MRECVLLGALLVLGLRAGGPAAGALQSCTDGAWPAMDVFVPVHLLLETKQHTKLARDRNVEFLEFCLRTYLLFWPYREANTTLRVVVDEERRNTTHFAELEAAVLAKLPSPQHVQFSFIAESPWYNGYGALRQQYAMFWADNFTSAGAEFVAFADGDTAFTTCVERGDLFEGGRPVINGRFGVETRMPWRAVPMTTFAITGWEEPMRGMAYFPVVVRIAHLPLIREHIRRHLKKATFDEAFQSFSGYFSQFNIMCTVLWWKRELRDQYRWYVHDFSPTWDGFRNPAPNNGQWSDRSIFSRDMWQPKPRIAVHARWHDHWAKGALTIYTDTGMLERFLQRGVCDCPPLPKRQAFCRTWQEQGRVSFGSAQLPADPYSGYNREMHSFEFVDYFETANRSDILRMHRERLGRLEACNRSLPIWEESLLT